jgi:hypothetical protein
LYHTTSLIPFFQHIAITYFSAMHKSGTADLPLHSGKVPLWLAERMSTIGTAIIEAIVQEHGIDQVLTRLSDPFWFQALGCVMGMDWHSSGITTSVMGALKRGLNPRAHELGIYICGGRGNHSRNTPSELLEIAMREGLDGDALVTASRLSAKVDNTCIQDGFSIYLHSFIVTRTGTWAVVQQGMNQENGMARRYHWHSSSIRSFVSDPHTAVVGRSVGPIINLSDSRAEQAQTSIVDFSTLSPEKQLTELRHLVMARPHEIKPEHVNSRRLGAVMALAYEKQFSRFTDFLLLEGVGPRTLQSLALVSEVIYGAPSRFDDPARFSFAHGGKDGVPFPVPLKTYDESIQVLQTAVNQAKLGHTDKIESIRKLHNLSLAIEKHHEPFAHIPSVISHEKRTSYRYGGRTIKGYAKPPADAEQLSLFD